MTINYTEALTQPDTVYTVIAGVHTPIGIDSVQNIPEEFLFRDFECLVVNNTNSNFTIRMKSSINYY